MRGKEVVRDIWKINVCRVSLGRKKGREREREKSNCMIEREGETRERE